MFYFLGWEHPRCIAGSPTASTRPQKVTTSAWRPLNDEDQRVIIEKPEFLTSGSFYNYVNVN